jgi:hypothetical protein
MCIHSHWLDASLCSLCRRVSEQAPVPRNPLRSLEDGTPALLLRVPTDGRAYVLTASGLSHVADRVLHFEVDPQRLRAMRVQLMDVARRKGFVFVPTRPLTWREQLDEVGPPHCYFCRIVLSAQAGSLGCSACNYYVCSCGRCLCGYTGRNWRGDLFSQFPELPISRDARLEFVRAFRFLSRS